MQSLYETLGVDRDATPDQIKAAHRRAAKETHPDTADGSREAFDEVQKAYGILADTRTRARYDETGYAGEQTSEASLAAKAQVTLAAKFLNLFSDQGVDIVHHDLTILVREHLSQDIQATTQAVNGAEKRRDRFKQGILRLRAKDVNSPVLHMLNQQIDQAEQQIQMYREQIEVLEAAKEALGAYTYKADERPMANVGDMFSRPGGINMINPRGGFGGMGGYGFTGA